MKIKLYERDGYKLVQGIVVEKRPGTGAAAGRVVNIKIKGDEYDTAAGANKEVFLDVAFWNSESRPLADNANSRLEVGNYVSILTNERDGKVFASAFKKQGIWKFAESMDEEGNIHSEANIIIGLIVNGTLNEDKTRYRASIPVTVFDSTNTPVTEWVSVTFFSNESNPKLPENAATVLSPYTPEGAEKPIRKRAAIRCGAKSTYLGTDGNERTSYSGYGFDRIE